MIVITGATGELGSRIAHRLLDRLGPDRVAVSVREPGRAAGLADRGVDVRQADYDDPAALAAAFADAEQVLLVSGGVLGPEGVAQHQRAIDAAAAVGARVVYTSHQNAAHDSAFAAAPQHAETEDRLAASGTAWTSPRNGFYANTVPFLMGPALETGLLTAPADGPVSWTTRDDLADAAVEILLDPGRFDGPTPALTGAEAVDFAGVAAALAELSGRPVERVVLTDDEWVAGLVERGTPIDRAQMLLGFFHAARRGEFDVVDPTLAGLVGRAPTSLRSVLEPVTTSFGE